jgi:ABC-type glycerol-3-phosphate transport system substrate-binding protein
MIGIPKACRNPDRAWQLIEHLYFSPEGMEARRLTGILPPIKLAWDDPYYHQPDEFFGGQKVNELFTELARQIPRRYVTPATAIAQTSLSVVLNRAVRYIDENGGSADGLEAQCQAWLNAAADDLQRRMDHWRFDE